jgi:hypothetical protein
MKSEAAKEAARVRNRRWRERHRDEDVARSAARHAANREEYNARARAWHEAHREEANARNRARYAANRGEWRRAVHGVSAAEHEALYAGQEGRCAICQEPRPKTGPGCLHIDHDHDTGERRGLLCRNCNSALPAFETLGATWMLRALAYLGDPPLRRLRKDLAS